MANLHTLDIPSCWTGASLLGKDWIRPLLSDEIAALEDVTARVAADISDQVNELLDLDLRDAIPQVLLALAAELKQELVFGRGFVMLRGLPVDRWTRLQTIIAYWTLGVTLGKPVPNNGLGDMIGHVRSVGADYMGANVRGYQTSAKLTYHCDQCDMVGLLCLQSSQTGGHSKLASTAAVYNTMKASRPELLALLEKPFLWSRLGEVGAGEKPWYEATMFEFVEGKFHSCAGTNHIRKGHVLPGTPPLTSEQNEALDLFETTAESLELSMSFQPGDIQLLNNGLVVHTRTVFTEWPESNRKRHLLRLWLNDPMMHRGVAYYDVWQYGVSSGHATRTIRTEH